MCAISGLLNLGGRQADIALLDRISASMRRRGPDGRAVMGFGSCALAHERLAILDIEGGRQPLLSEDGRVAVVVNGEIYNHKALRQELIARGHRFATHSDSEVVVHSYEQFGSAAFAKLRGMFAIAVWDLDTQTLVLARDGLGKKPLAYTWIDADTFLFASDIRAFHQHPDFAPQLSARGLAEYLGYRCVADPGSIYDKVHKVPAGQWLAVDRYGTITHGTHWSLPAAGTARSYEARTEAELCEELRGRVSTAVERRLMSEVPAGVLLSGGIDSTIVAHEAARMHPGVSTFTLGFVGTDDECEVARITAQALGTRHHEMRIELQPRQAMEEAEAAYDEPFADSSSVASVRICRAAREQVGVVLLGDGGDEGFAGYPRAGLIAAISDPAATLPSAIALKVQARIGRKPARRRAKQLLLAREALDDYFHPFERWRALQWIFAPADVRRMVGAAVPATHWPEVCTFEEAEADDYEVYLRNDLLVKMDRASMHCGLEARSPLLDDELIAYARSLPLEWKLRDGKTKYLLRRAYAGRLPEHIWHLRKRGFASPTKKWLNGVLRADVDELARDRQQPLYRHLDYAQVMAATANMNVDAGHKKIWTLLILNRWLRREPSRPRAT